MNEILDLFKAESDWPCRFDLRPRKVRGLPGTFRVQDGCKKISCGRFWTCGVWWRLLSPCTGLSW